MEANMEMGTSISDEILKELLSKLKTCKQFDEDVIEEIESLWRSGEIRKAAQIIKAVKVQPRKQL